LGKFKETRDPLTKQIVSKSDFSVVGPFPSISVFQPWGGDPRGFVSHL